jgi:hypothetical protein
MNFIVKLLLLLLLLYFVKLYNSYMFGFSNIVHIWHELIYIFCFSSWPQKRPYYRVYVVLIFLMSGNTMSANNQLWCVVITHTLPTIVTYLIFYLLLLSRIHISIILWDPKVNYRVENSLPLVPILSQTNSIQTSPLY